MNEPHGSGNTDDIYNDLDSLFIPGDACGNESKQESMSDVSDLTKPGNNSTSAPSQSASTSNFSLNEDQLKKEEMILYLDLVVNELDNKKALLNLKNEYIKLKKETDALRKAVSEKDEKISQLTAEVVTLKKNICSLYKTAKFEIEQKDAMLLEANKEIDKVYTHSGKSSPQNKHSTESSQNQQSTSRMSHVPSQDFKQYEAREEVQNYKNKRKRSHETPETENPAFTRPSSSFNQSENHPNWNRFHSRHKFPRYESEKRSLLPAPSPINEKCNSYNYNDRRKNHYTLKSNQNKHSKERSPKL